MEEHSHRSKIQSVFHNPYIWIGFIFVISRVIYYWMGVRFDVLTFEHGWYILDVNLLKTRLLESLLYMHIQPPLQNLFIGIILKWFPQSYGLVFNIIYICLSLVMSMALLYIQRKLDILPVIAFITTTIFMVNPTWVAYENWFHYTLPTAALLALSVVFLIRFLESQRRQDGFLFFGALAYIALMRSTYHLLWYIALVTVLLLFQKKLRRLVLITALLPFIIISAWYLKNLVIFNQFSASSWMGMNLAKATIYMIPIGQRQDMVKSGELSPIVLLDTFEPLEKYHPFLPDNQIQSGIPVLDQETNTFNQPNFNNKAYLGIAKQYQDNALKVVFNHPEIYKSGILFAWEIGFRSPQDFIFIADNLGKMSTIAKWYNLFYYGVLGKDASLLIPTGHFEYIDWTRIGFLSILNYLLMIGMAIWSCFKWVSAKNEKGKTTAFIFLFTCLLIGYTTVASNTFEASENNRYRMEVEPLMVVVSGLLLTIITNATRRWWKKSGN